MDSASLSFVVSKHLSMFLHFHLRKKYHYLNPFAPPEFDLQRGDTSAREDLTHFASVCPKSGCPSELEEVRHEVTLEIQKDMSLILGLV